MEKSKVYKLKDAYYNLDLKGREIIDNIARFCDENNRFPKDKEISEKNGYIARSQIFKYFNCNSFKVIYNYIEKIEESIPKTMKCIKCEIEKPFTKDNFGNQKRMKFGLSHTCKECECEMSLVRYLNGKGIVIKELDDLSIFEWYELSLKGELRRMPKKYLNEECYSKIIRYIITEKNGVPVDKNAILDVFKGSFIKEAGVTMWIQSMGGKISCLNKCFPEIEFVDDDLFKYSEEDDMEILERNLAEQSMSTIDILNGKFDMRKNNELTNLSSRYLKDGIGTNDLYLKYFKYKNIKHPITKREICIYDFKNKPCGFYEDINIRRNAIKHYCENICKVSILNVIKNTNDLQEWIKRYFKQKDVISFMNYLDYYESLYDCLIDAYPCIYNDKILFDWEWTQVSYEDSDILIRMLREFVMYRIPNIKNIKEEAPKYLNRTYFKLNYPKMEKHISRNRFSNFYEWAILSFPEYKDYWNKSMFNIIESYDGYEFDSHQEKCVYEYIKDNFFEFIVPIGRKRQGEFIFTNNKSAHSKYCPDYVVEYVLIDGEKVKIDKPIIIEYYGLYDESNVKNEFMSKYMKKTHEKEKFYKKNNNIYYIGIYPKHIKPNFDGLNELCHSFIEGTICKLCSENDKVS